MTPKQEREWLINHLVEEHVVPAAACCKGKRLSQLREMHDGLHRGTLKIDGAIGNPAGGG
jgi:hypothetical protein